MRKEMHLFANRTIKAARKLLYSALLIAPLLSYPSESHGIPRGDKPLASRSIKATSCKFKGDSFVYSLSGGKEKTLSDLLSKGEKVHGIKCNDAYAFILTDTSLIVVPGVDQKNEAGRFSLKLEQIRMDLKRVHQEGLVSWIIGNDRSFFLTKKGKIWEVPAISNESTIPVHSISGNTSNADMAFHSGFLFIAPIEGRIIIMKITDKARYVELDLPVGMDGSRFFLKNKRLYYGKDGRIKFELRINGEKPADVKLIDKN